MRRGFCSELHTHSSLPRLCGGGTAPRISPRERQPERAAAQGHSLFKGTSAILPTHSAVRGQMVFLGNLKSYCLQKNKITVPARCCVTKEEHCVSCP